MNLPLGVFPAPLQQHIAAQLEAWVYRGLLAFWQRALPADHGVFQLMHLRACELLAKTELPAWDSDWPWDGQLDKDFPLQQLIKDFSLTPASLYVLALAGHLESSHLVNLAVAELQAPDRAPRLGVHLASALGQNLFGEALQAADIHQPLGALAVARHPLIAKHILGLQGDGPLPLQRLTINPWLWALLLGGRPYWPDVNALQAETHCDIAPGLARELHLSVRLLRQHHAGCAGLMLRGNPHSGRTQCAHLLAQSMGLHAVEIPVDIWLAQPVLMQACRYGKWLPILRLTSAPARSLGLAQSPVPVVVILPNDVALHDGNLLELDIGAPSAEDRRQLWLREFNDIELSTHLAACARLSARSIRQVAGSARQIAELAQQPLGLEHIRAARARLGVDKLRLLAQPVFRQVDENALVVPPLVNEGLQLVLRRAHQRESLWQGLGSTLSVTPNPGVRALFTGESGTGKTLAASYIATCLAAPLYRVDLSAVMNKYIGESEKNLAQLLDYAAAADVVLLFDEADALFGNRGDGQETGERFANMLTNFLLTRIETHPGIVILTTNSRERIDNAFTRRLDVIVEFPMPDFEERLHLWRSHLGERGPGEEVYRNLATYCDLAGGQLRNVVLTAASFASDRPIRCEHLLEGLKAEYRKQGRDLPRKLEGLAAPINS
jgi:hypothetical protein